MQSEKLHSACDECRSRKLKCSGTKPICMRCQRENITCNYSPQKPMGRPRKRRRDDAATEQEASISPANASSIPETGYGNPGVISTDDISDLPGFGDQQQGQGFSEVQIPTCYSTELPQLGAIQNIGLDQMDPVIDPLLWQQPLLDTTIASTTATMAPNSLAHSTSHVPILPDSAPEGGPCTCFSVMYLTVSDLQSLTDLSFPAVVPRLRQAMVTAMEILNCPRCPKDLYTSMQNVQSVTAVLSALAERFHAVLRCIEKEARVMLSEGRKKSFKIGDGSVENMREYSSFQNNPFLIPYLDYNPHYHCYYNSTPKLIHLADLHTGAPDCPMAFEIQLDPLEWSKFAKRGLKTEVLGGGQNKTPLVSLVDAMEVRQHRWHTDKSMLTEDRLKIFGVHKDCDANPGESATCLRMVNQVRRMIDAMEWE